MGLYQLKPAFQRTLQPLATWLIARGVSADAISASAVVLALAGGVLLLAGPSTSLALLAPIAGLRLACNALDGMVARATGPTRPRGFLVNELSDRLADVVLLAALGWASGLDPGLALLAPLLALMSSHVALAGQAAGGARPTSGPMGKSERMAVLALAGLASAALQSRLPLAAAVLVILVGAALTLADRTRRVYRGLGAGA